MPTSRPDSPESSAARGWPARGDPLDTRGDRRQPPQPHATRTTPACPPSPLPAPTRPNSPISGSLRWSRTQPNAARQERGPEQLRGNIPGTTNCCCEHAFQRRLIGRPCRAPPNSRGEVSTVELLVARCAGLDVAKDEVVACVRVPDGHGGRGQEVRTFQTFTSGLP